VTILEAGPSARSGIILLGGRFRLAEQISESGGITLWRATDEMLHRAVAVHLLPDCLPVLPDMAEAVQAGARVSDPRFATVYDADYGTDGEGEPEAGAAESGACPYIVSEWAADPSLTDLLLTGLPHPLLASHIVAEAADALAVAHEAGRPHLCLTPLALHWGRSGLKITGLGIDAALSGATAADPAAAETEALASILYALLTGYWPGDEATGLPPAPRTRAGLYEPRQIRTDVPAILNAITCQALPFRPGTLSQCRTPAQLAATLRAARLPSIPRPQARGGGVARPVYASSFK
jgi:hypothetical protein